MHERTRYTEIYTEELPTPPAPF